MREWMDIECVIEFGTKVNPHQHKNYFLTVFFRLQFKPKQKLICKIIFLSFLVRPREICAGLKESCLKENERIRK